MGRRRKTSVDVSLAFTEIPEHDAKGRLVWVDGKQIGIVWRVRSAYWVACDNGGGKPAAGTTYKTAAIKLLETIYNAPVNLVRRKAEAETNG